MLEYTEAYCVIVQLPDGRNLAFFIQPGRESPLDSMHLPVDAVFHTYTHYMSLVHKDSKLVAKQA